MEDSEKPSFENFLSKPSTLTDHLMWQLGSLHVNEDVYRAAELVIGNLNEEGYLTATDDELLGLANDEANAPRAEPVCGDSAVAPAMSAPVTDETQPEISASNIAVAEEEFSAGGLVLRHRRRARNIAAERRSLLVLRWCLRVPCPLAFRSAGMPWAKPSIWSSKWTPLA
jgi:RNA polymerase sigma-54 factor